MDQQTSPATLAALETQRRLEAEREFHNRKFGEAKEHRGSNAIYELPRAAYRAFERQLEPLARGADILEYGCGDCSYVARLADWGGRVTAIDISEEAVETARVIATEKGIDASFAVMNAEELTFPDESFDLVIGRAILHHLDLEKAYASIARVLRPGGTAIFLEPMAHNPLIEIYRRFTPHLRTVDEHPLLVRDFDMARRHFGTLELDYFTLLSMGALVFAKVPGLFQPALKALDAADAGLFRVLPGLGRYAWTAKMVMRRPLKG
ncbi:MAG TPA: class I SAM-dependent methyltransferase [Allosphingosinicella sp.]|nr:class I SAM-dependent methyltransferase [Allosphingosinicella sp.]